MTCFATCPPCAGCEERERQIRLLVGASSAWERVARQLYREYADYAADGDADVTPLEWFVERYGKKGETNG